MWQFLLWSTAVVAALYLLICGVYWALQERFIFVRFRLRQDHVFRFAGPFEEVFLEPGPGIILHALWFKVAAPRGTVLYFHGNTGSLRRWGRLAATFTGRGWNVLMVDYRGYGKSRGPLDEAALHADAARWYAWLKDREPEDRIVVYGRSLGSGFAVPVAAANRPHMLLLESPFANLFDPARHQFFLIPYRWLLRYRFRNDKAIRRVRCPVYIFHGLRDPVVPHASALRLYSLVSADVRREMVTLPRGYHSDLARFGRFRRGLSRLLGAPRR